MAADDRLPTTLIDLLSNALVLRQTAPYLPVKELRWLAATCKALRELIYSQSDAWRHLDLTAVKRAIIESSPIDVGGFSWRAERMDESLTEDDFYSGPLRGIFGSLHSQRILKYVQTLVLDGLTVPADLVREIVAEDRYRVKLLSLRECKHLNVAKLQQVLRYVCRPTRAEGTPLLRGLYVFGRKDAPRAVTSAYDPSPPRVRDIGVMSASGAQIGADWNQRSSEVLALRLSDEESQWYSSNGRVIKRPYGEWAETLQVCKGLINFDAVLCRGPRHDITKVDSKDFLQPSIATAALGKGCQTCASCPEGPAVFGQSQDSTLPLLGPAPIHSSSVKAALRPEQGTDGKFPRLILRCEDCLRNRWCEQCNRFWCEDCYREPVSRAHLRTEIEGWTGVQGADTNSVKIGVHRDCFACGRTCESCKTILIRQCRTCRSEYCLPHDEGCSKIECGWCNSSGRRTRELF